MDTRDFLGVMKMFLKSDCFGGFITLNLLKKSLSRVPKGVNFYGTQIMMPQ